MFYSLVNPAQHSESYLVSFGHYTPVQFLLEFSYHIKLLTLPSISLFCTSSYVLHPCQNLCHLVKIILNI
jgi:hypothetical protein